MGLQTVGSGEQPGRVARDDGPVDFEPAAAADDPGAEEDLPEPVGRNPAGTMSQRRSLVLAALILVALALGARALTKHDRSSTAPSAASSSTVAARPTLSPSPELAAPGPGESDVLVVLPNGGLSHAAGVIVARESDTRCPAPDIGLTCMSSAKVSAAFLSAVVAAFPGARPTSALAVETGGTGEGGQQLHFARLTARAAGVEILIQVQQGSVQTGPDVSSDDGRRTVIYRTYRADGYLVQVLTSAPSGHAPSPARVAKLVADPRLLIAP